MQDDAAYADVVTYLKQRRDYWINNTQALNQPDDTDRAMIWSSAGGYIVPWLGSSTIEATEVEQKYSPSNAPNIIFVLADDWGYNDFGLRSTYLGWTTPNVDKLAQEGVLFENYYTNELCAPSRSSFVTGRFNSRLGVYTNEAELPLNETTIAQELQTAGYRTYAIGKWHLGMSTYGHWPLQRGFDYFYGYLSGEENYYTKSYDEYLDLQEDNSIVTDETALDTSYHSAYLFELKAEAAIKNHVANYPEQPMFMYYAMQLIHSPWTAPDVYLDRCEALGGTNSTERNYCGLNLMLDEAIANLTCTIESAGIASNTILIVSGDNGGEKTVNGNCYPFKGSKGSWMRGGVSNTAIIHSPLLPEKVRGTTVSDIVHITDWLPTIMNMATNGEWTGSSTEAAIDGVDIWDAVKEQSSITREEIVFHSYNEEFAMLYGNYKFLSGTNTASGETPDYFFESDQDPSLSSKKCSDPSLMSSDSLTYLLSLLPKYSVRDGHYYLAISAMIVAIFVAGFFLAWLSTSSLKASNESNDRFLKYSSSGETVPIISSRFDETECRWKNLDDFLK